MKSCSIGNVKSHGQTFLKLAKKYSKVSYDAKLCTCSSQKNVWIQNSQAVGGFPIEIESQISLLITCSLAIFII